MVYKLQCPVQIFRSLFPNTIFVAGLTILEPVPEDLEVNKVSSLEDIPDDDQTGEKPKGRGKTYLFIFSIMVTKPLD